jgi:hypothetical protein
MPIASAARPIPKSFPVACLVGWATPGGAGAGAAVSWPPCSTTRNRRAARGVDGGDATRLDRAGFHRRLLVALRAAARGDGCAGGGRGARAARGGAGAGTCLRRRAGDRVLRGKTGWHRRTRVTNRGWLAGCLDGPTRVCFATVLAADEPFDHGAFLRARLDASVRLLQALGHAVPD